MTVHNSIKKDIVEVAWRELQLFRRNFAQLTILSTKLPDM